jgi:uncharacterized protein YecE (DUF72 family)
MKNWWVGCSGFYYKGWKEKFYPKEIPQRKWFEYYCESFNTVEINSTFYRFPRVESLKDWYNRSPDNFRFTVKASRLITHYKRFNNALTEINNFYDRVSKGLQDKLGTVLFQMHPVMQYSEESLERIIKTLDPTYTNALEFRHESWWRADVYKALKDNNIIFCGISYPSLPDDVIKTASTMYYRFHGVPQLYLSSYTDKELERISDSINRFRKVDDVYCYFNNDIEVAAISNAKAMNSMVQ